MSISAYYVFQRRDECETPAGRNIYALSVNLNNIFNISCSRYFVTDAKMIYTML